MRMKGKNWRLRSVFALSAAFACSTLPLVAMAESGQIKANTPPASATSKGSAVSAYRLSDLVIPVKYELDFTPDAEQGKFTGVEDIELQVKKSTASIILNAHDLTISTANLIADGQKPVPLQVKLDKTLERVSLIAAKPIAAGNYHVHCNFTGVLNDQLAGFYRSTFKDKEGKTHYLSVTQMEPTDARRMFPGFDEPAFKAKFKIKARIPADQAAISNAPVAKETVDKASGKKIVEFEETPPMSTYLVALLIGEFRATELIESDGTPIRVWSVLHDPALGNYARDNAGKILHYLNSYFGIPYPWKKLDFIAIPDFEAGAMENPGAITFREKYLLADEKTAALATKQTIVDISAHEMAHLWFGDLVTMKWWDDIWLNEAFATWMATRTVDHIHPEWNRMAEFFSDRLRALYTDSLHATRSIQSPVIKPDDAMQMFDEITYVKGSSVLRMLEYFLGEDKFQQGVSAYLKQHSFNNATTDDLWSALGKSSGQAVKQIMDTWCKQQGYPLVSVQSASGGQLKLSQLRFFLDGLSGGGHAMPGKELWQIPLGVRDLSAKLEPDANGRAEVKPDYSLVKERSASLKAPSAASEGLFANAGGWGFYRSEYAAALSGKISTKLSSLNAAERLCFLSDHAALATASKIPVTQYLTVLKAYRGETDAAVWNCMVDCFQHLDRFVAPSERNDFAKFVRHVLKEEYERLGWDSKADESAPTRLVRAQIISTLGTLGADPDVIARARKIFAEYVKDPNSANPDLLDAITNVVAYNGGKSDFDTIKSLWKKAANPEIEHRNLFALAGFRDKSMLEQGLALTLSNEVRSQDAPKMLAGFFDTTDAKQAAWQFMKSHWPQIKRRYAAHMLPRLSEAPQSLVTQKEYLEVNSFFASNKVKGGESDVSRMLEKLQINVLFGQRSGKALNSWLKENASNSK